MIISHKHKFIFLKTRKTAGTSIEIALSKYCGEDDIITPITPEDEEIRKELGYRGPQNYIVPYRYYSLNDWRQRIFHRKKAQYYNHIPACEVRQWIDPRIWNSYYKFCFERNPWDKAISLYYFTIGATNTTISLGEYLKKERRYYISNYPLYSINNQIAIDHVYLFEDLNTELNKIVQKIGIRETMALPRAKGNYRKDKRPYREVLGEKEKELIRDICQKEIELFGYAFE